MTLLAQRAFNYLFQCLTLFKLRVTSKRSQILEESKERNQTKRKSNWKETEK